MYASGQGTSAVSLHAALSRVAARWVRGTKELPRGTRVFQVAATAAATAADGSAAICFAARAGDDATAAGKV